MPVIVNKGKYLNLEQIKKLGKDHFWINEEYQRSKMWSDGKKQLLLDSIINGYPIGTFVLKKVPDGRFEVLDGQQRIEAIFCFTNGPLRTSSATKRFPNKDYQNLLAKPDLSADFAAFRIYYDEIESDDDQEIATVFLRLQEGAPLNTAEKLNAMSGEMRKFVLEISRHPLFGSTTVPKFRFAHRLLAAQIVMLENASAFDHLPYPDFPDLRFNYLKKMYKEFENGLPGGLSRRVVGTLNTALQSLKGDARVIRKKSDLPLVYLLVSYLRKKYIVDYRLFRNFIIEFFTIIAQVSLSEGEPAKNDFERYFELRRKGLTAVNFSERFRIMLSLFLNKAPRIKLKDPKRSFEVGQKLAIYYHKDKGICQALDCGKPVKFEDADFHHVVFHSAGGPTTVENGQLMHKDCHRKLHNEKGPDEE